MRNRNNIITTNELLTLFSLKLPFLKEDKFTKVNLKVYLTNNEWEIDIPKSTGIPENTSNNEIGNLIALWDCDVIICIICIVKNSWNGKHGQVTYIAPEYLTFAHSTAGYRYCSRLKSHWNAPIYQFWMSWFES